MNEEIKKPPHKAEGRTVVNLSILNYAYSVKSPLNISNLMTIPMYNNRELLTKTVNIRMLNL